jgi:murein DD-endopeptidase MepM/ murein hydrolase activator NlpD
VSAASAAPAVEAPAAPARQPRNPALARLSGKADTRPVGGDPGDVGLLGPANESDAPVVMVHEIPLRNDEPIDEWYPTLADWVHPVAAGVEQVPTKSTRRFGARRDGVGRADCGAGHCGVDLDGPRGQPIVAVAWGVVARIQSSASGRGGRYVRVEHPDGIFTSYMHLDDIAPDLALGDEIEAGTVLGTLGRTGIHHSTPHLHFSLEIPAEDDAERWTYIDPLPFLARARLVELAEITGTIPESTVVTIETEEPEAIEAIAPPAIDAAMPAAQIAAPMNAPM